METYYVITIKRNTSEFEGRLPAWLHNTVPSSNEILNKNSQHCVWDTPIEAVHQGGPRAHSLALQIMQTLAFRLGCYHN